MRLVYAANIRLPTEKAHGYQIMQMCEAFSAHGQVRLIVPRRRNTPEMNAIPDPFVYYGVDPIFEIVRLPCIDALAVFPKSRVAFWVQTSTFLLALMVWLLFRRYDLLFSRDMLLMAVLAWIVPRRRTIYEVHHKARSTRARWLQGRILRRVGRVVSLTGTMAKQLENMGAPSVIVAHDGIRSAYFPNIPNISQKRLEMGINGLVCCYAGRLNTMGMSKGLDVFVEAAAQVGGISFLMVGGPAEQVEALRAHWVACGLPADQFHAVGMVPPTEVPHYLALADVCLITSPRNEFFANETSPMKLFEYMRAGRAIIASDLPSTREVVTHGESAYLVEPSSVAALAEALTILRDDAALRQQLGENAAQAVLAYTWAARAERILVS